MRAAAPRQKTHRHKLLILQLIRRHQSLSVPDLRLHLPLSYMGIKEHCEELAGDGYLAKTRKPKTSGRGRPEVAYHLLPAAETFFPRQDAYFTLQLFQALHQLYGTNAPEKILFTIHQNLMGQFREKLGALTGRRRVESFLQLRREQGYLVEMKDDPSGQWELEEYHSPIDHLIPQLPSIMNFELQLHRKCLHSQVRRIHLKVSPYRVRYVVPHPSHENDS